MLAPQALADRITRSAAAAALGAYDDGGVASRPTASSRLEVTKLGALSPWHWAILAIVVILLFGAKRLPDAARSLGKSMRIFKAEVKELQNDSHRAAGDPGAARSHSRAVRASRGAGTGPRPHRRPSGLRTCTVSTPPGRGADRLRL